MKKEYILLLFGGFVTLVCVLFPFLFTKDNAWEEGYYGKETFAERKNISSRTDKEAVLPVLELANRAFSYIGQEEAIPEEFGVLKRYCYTKDKYKELAYERHKIKLITVKLEKTTGYMWINYSRTGFGKYGKCLYRSPDSDARWTLAKVNGQWVVTEIKEHP